MAGLTIAPLHPSCGGGTSVANMPAAFNALPADEHIRLQTLKTVNGLDNKVDTRPEDIEAYDKPIVHPMVRTHALHGSKAVYFHVSTTKYIYYHQWRKGDVPVIDDCATMHRAHGDYDQRQARVLRRIIAAGDRPVLV